MHLRLPEKSQSVSEQALLWMGQRRPDHPKILQPLHELWLPAMSRMPNMGRVEAQGLERLLSGPAHCNDQARLNDFDQ